MQITLIKEQTVKTFVLPEKVKGQFWVTDKKQDNHDYDFISIEAVDKDWILKSNKTVTIVNDQGHLKNVKLENQQIYRLKILEDETECLLFTEPVSVDRQVYEKVIIPNNTRLRIGRSDLNDIVFRNRFASTNHAELSLQNGKWYILDKKSTNGTFVNGLRITETQVFPGDSIYIMGLKIIVGHGLIAYNNPDNLVELKSDIFEMFTLLLPKPIEDEIEEKIVDYFSRSPRFKNNIEEAVFRIDNPPSSSVGEETPLLLVMGPALTMGLTSMTTGLFAVNNAISNGNISNAFPSIIMSLSMLMGSLLWPSLNKRYEKQRKLTREARRIKKYNEYLDYYHNVIEKEINKQKEIHIQNSLSIEECIDIIEKRKRNLWERSENQDDFLKLKLGNGNLPLETKIVYSERRFTLDEDDLQEKMLELCESQKMIQDVPITISLVKDYILGVIGERKRVIDLAKSLIYQIVTYYGYDEVKTIFIYDENDKEFEFVKWLPHSWSNDRRFRFIANTPEEVKELSSYFEKEIEYRDSISENNFDDIKVHYIVFALDRNLTLRSDLVKQVLALSKSIKFSVLTFYEELSLLPKECSAIVEVSDECKVFDKNDASRKSLRFTLEKQQTHNSLRISSALSNIYLDTLDSKYKLPKIVTFLEMFNVGKIEHLNANIRWKENDPTKTLQTEVGVDAYGGIFKLDLHEKYHGPHGLVAGMTGSGKSEFIISYILSLAVNYHPYEVAFILIDYKGGGMAKSFENLPHTVGIITNLDGSAIKRSLISIESELKRRQALFASASKNNNISNIDIYKYQKLFREGIVSEPLPHLFIISDEFAELKTQQSEFMAQLVSAARIGRSLGIHLVLATQKPAGVVDDQIWSNSKFRVCLKVQERADSMDMLKRPDAAELIDTGRFYLQVGYNELFEIGQSAWAGAPYIESEKVIKEVDNSVVFIDKNGRILSQLSPMSKEKLVKNPRKQMEMITEYLWKTANEEKIVSKPLWLDPLPGIINLDELSKKYNHIMNPNSISALIGEIDDPRNQRQSPLYFSISEFGNTVLYGSSGSGKTEFLSILVYSLIREYSPKDINIYLLDFSSEFLKAFSNAPHVGDVILSHEVEKISNLLKMIKKEVDYRKKLLSKYGGVFKVYNESNDEKLPTILIGINNFAAFMEIYPDGEDAIYYLTRECSKYGIYFLATSMSTNSIRFRLIQNFKQLITLQLNDESEYSTILGKTEGLTPARFVGRGLIKIEGELFEFQSASIGSSQNLYKSIQDYCMLLNEKYNYQSARKIPILPEKVTMNFLSSYINNSKLLRIPIGIEKASLQPHYYDFETSYIHLVLSTGNSSSYFAKTFSEFIYSYVIKDVVLFTSNHDEVNDDYSVKMITKVEDTENEISSLFELVRDRNNQYKDCIEKGIQVPIFDHKVIVINSLLELKAKLQKLENDKLDMILEKGESRYNITIIISEMLKNLSGVTVTPWYKKHIIDSNGLWVGSGMGDQFYIKVNKNSFDLDSNLSNDFAYSVSEGKPVIVKVLNEQEVEQ